MSEDDDSAAGRGLAAKLDRLFRTVHPPDRGPYSNEEVAAALDAAGGPRISVSYLYKLRRGLSPNPTMRHLEALAQFFGVPPSYFFNESESAEIAAQLDLLAAMRDGEIKSVALRAAGLSTESLGAIRVMIEQARRLEGLPDGEHPERPGDAPTSD